MRFTSGLRLRRIVAAAVSLTLLITALALLSFARDAHPRSRVAITKSKLAENLGRTPLVFEPNHGQMRSDIEFRARGQGFEALLKNSGATILLPSARALQLSLIDGNRSSATPHHQLSSRSNYLIGRDQSGWHTNVPNYSEVEYSNLYRGIDLRYHGTQRELEYDFIVSPGADPNAIGMRFSGDQTRRINSAGDLILGASQRELILHKPVAYQPARDGRRNVAAQFRLRSDGTLTFDLAKFDRSAPLIIDPVITYATYIGGVFSNAYNSMAIDRFGNAYIAGTAGIGFPTTSGTYQTSLKGDNDVFVSKLNADGSQLIYSTYIGGSLDDAGYAVAIDDSGHAYVTGVTESSDFPVLNTSFGGSTHAANSHTGFVLELTSDGAGLVYSSYLGGTQSEFVNWIAVDPNCTSNCGAYLAGGTQSPDFPTTSNAFQSSLAGSQDAFITKVGVVDGLATLSYSSFIGGPTFSGALAIAVDGSQNAYLTGNAGAGFPSTIGAPFGGDEDAFVTKINTTASGAASLVYSTYVGGSGRDQGEGIALPSGCISNCAAYITGMTSSPDFPVTANVVQPSLAGYEEAYVTQLSSSGAIAYSTFFGGAGLDYGQAVAVNSSGDAFITGYSDSPNLPSIDPVQKIPAPNGKLFKFSSSGGSIMQTGWPPIRAGSARSIARDTTTTPNTLYVGTNREGIWKSSSDGASFSATGLNDGTVYALGLDKLAPSTLLAGTAKGLMVTTDGGVSFASIEGGLPANLLVYSILGEPGLLMIGTNQGLFRSTDGAMTFAAAAGVASTTQVYALTSDSSAMYAGTGVGVLKSSDGGVSFAATNMTSNTVYAMVDDATSTPPKVYAGTIFSGVAVSTDGFKTNVRGADITVSPQAIFSLAIDPNTSNPATVYAGASNFVAGAVFASTDGGLTYALAPASAPLQSGVLQPINVEGGMSGDASTIFAGVDDEFYAYLAELNPDATQLLLSTYVGGTTSTASQGIALDASGNIFLSGYTASTNFPTTPGVFQPTFGTNAFDNAFAAKIALALPSPSATPTPNGAEISAPSSVTLVHVGIGNGKMGTGKLTIRNTGKGGDLIGSITNQTNPLFTLSATTFDIAPKKSSIIDASCTPDALSDIGSVTLSSNASNASSLDVALECTGLPGKLSVRKTLFFRTKAPLFEPLTLKNVGRGVLTLSAGAATPSPSFQGGGQTIGIAPGGETVVNVLFDPQMGTATGSIELTATPPSTGSTTVTLEGIAK